MKKSLLLTLLLATMVTACGQSKTTIDLSETQKSEESLPEEKELESASTAESAAESTIIENDAEAEIILRMIDFNGSDIQSYVSSLQEEDPDGKYSVYNDAYYITTIKESDRKEMLSSFSDKSFVESSFQNLFSDDTFAGAFTSMSYDDKFQHIDFVVDKELFEQNSFACNLGARLASMVISDSFQAYSLIRPEDRITEITFTDKETGEKIDLPEQNRNCYFCT